jgi:general secretion pathway protein E
MTMIAYDWRAACAQQAVPAPAFLAHQMGLDELRVLEDVSAHLRWPLRTELPINAIDLDLVKCIPLSLAKRAWALPIAKTDEGLIDIACADPFRSTWHHDLAMRLPAPARYVLASSSVVQDAINAAYAQLQASAADVLEHLDTPSLDTVATAITNRPELLDAQDDAPVIQLVNALLTQAAKQRASDIHLEAYETTLHARLRIDGVLQTVLTPPKTWHDAIVARIKIMAGLDIAEKRRPQDGRIGLKIAGRTIDFRVSVLPTAHGERVVLRLLEHATTLHTLEDLGMTGSDLRAFRGLIRQPHGIILVTGPTGSGKTTTLYAALTEINSTDRNIMTLEDPIEKQIPGINQTQVNPKIDLTFAAGLRAILRQDPDTLLLGEARDRETAQIAVQASLTGHLVLTTLHTNDAPSALTRLIDMGIEPFLLSSTVIGILAQRLVRTICPQCAEPFRPSDTDLNAFGLTRDAGGHFRRGAGCSSCLHSGYLGRRGLYELLIMTDALRSQINTNPDAAALRRLAIAGGMTTLRQAGLALVQQGITTLEEVARVTQDATADIGELS